MNIHGLSWFPNCAEKLVTWGQDISIYEVKPKVDNEAVQSRSIRISSKLQAHFIAAENRYQYVRCLSPSYHKDMPIVAAGLADGKIGISNFQQTVEPNWEFTPRQQRSCLCLAWNEIEPNTLAIGHDRNRSDSCITIWDIDKGLPKETSNFYGISESANSICWDKNHRTLVAGMSQKLIKVFDLRQANTSCQSVQTKAVHGLSVAPNAYYLCSYLDSVIVLWDLRSIDKPLKQIQTTKNNCFLSWCPTRASLLSSLQRDSPFVSIYDIRSVDVDSGREIYFIKNQFLPFQSKFHTTNKNHSIVSVSWHSKDLESAIVLSESGNIITLKIPSVNAISFNNKNKFSPTIMTQNLSPPSTPSSTESGESFMGSNNWNFSINEILEDDIVEVIRKRALSDYGIKTDIKRYGDLLRDPNLKNVWLSLENLLQDERLIGIKTVLGIGSSQTSEALMASSRIESQVLKWPDFINNSSDIVCYRSDQRDAALRLCGWSNEQDLERFVSKLCDKKEFSRAAMICVFHLKILLACDILSKAADQSSDPSMFRIAAIALSSFNADRCSVAWRNQRSNANMQIQDAHLRAIFSFLTMENENFDTVLEEEGVSLADRVAFGCKYLSESKLSEYVKQCIQKSTEKGDLNGLLLTGDSLDGINVLQSYIDCTLDVQTVSLIAIWFFSNERFSDNRIQYWISSYLDLLDRWGLWEKRAELEIKMESFRTTPRSSKTVYLLCNFCGKSVSNVLQEDARVRNATSNVNKLSSCPSCRKPLPRCSLCLLHMGTTVCSSSPSDSGHESLGWQSKPFAKWFSWCQTCRHGGHTEHIMQWFRQNSECPVSSCSCKCFDMDGTLPLQNYRDNY